MVIKLHKKHFTKISIHKTSLLRKLKQQDRDTEMTQILLNNCIIVIGENHTPETDTSFIHLLKLAKHLHLLKNVSDLAHSKKLTGQEESRIYFPLSPTYPGFNLFYYDIDLTKQEATFYCIQISIDKDPMDHVLRNDNPIYEIMDRSLIKPNSRLSIAIRSWIEYLPENTKFIEIWMLDKDNLKEDIVSETRKNRLDQMNVIFLQDMKNLHLFGLLDKYFQKTKKLKFIITLL